MAITTEQEVIDLIYPDDNTKTISDLINFLQSKQTISFTVDEIKTQLKLDFTDVTDWSI